MKAFPSSQKHLRRQFCFESIRRHSRHYDDRIMPLHILWRSSVRFLQAFAHDHEPTLRALLPTFFCVSTKHHFSVPVSTSFLVSASFEQSRFPYQHCISKHLANAQIWNADYLMSYCSYSRPTRTTLVGINWLGTLAPATFFAICTIHGTCPTTLRISSIHGLCTNTLINRVSILEINHSLSASFSAASSTLPSEHRSVPGCTSVLQANARILLSSQTSGPALLQQARPAA